MPLFFHVDLPIIRHWRPLVKRCVPVEPIAKKLNLTVDFNHGANDCKAAIIVLALIGDSAAHVAKLSSTLGAGIDFFEGSTFF